MAFYHVLLNGTGTSGDGSTWDDASDATSAYIGNPGFNTISSAAAAGDIIFVKGADSDGTTMNIGLGGTLANSRQPIRILGCKSATTNTGGSIVTSDLIPGLRTGDSDEAWNDADIPSMTTTATINLQAGMYIYGIKFESTAGDCNLATAGFAIVIAEECYFEGGSSSDATGASGNVGRLIAINCKLVSGSTGRFQDNGYSEYYNCIFSSGSGTAFFDNENFLGDGLFRGCTFEGGETNIIQRKNTSIRGTFLNCKFPGSWALATGTAAGEYLFESYGSDDTSGLTAGGSEQDINFESQHGTVSTETTKVRTGGADDGAAGGYSYDMSPFADGTLANFRGLVSPWLGIWVAGDGTAQTLTVYFASDSGNTNSSDWNDDEVWLEVEYPDDGGTSIYDRSDSRPSILTAGSAVTDDTTSTWGAGTQNPQKLQASIAPDYEGYVLCRVHFAPGANADTIYVDPSPEVA